MKEDSQEFGIQYTRNNDDEEKFFDRVTEEMQLASMDLAGYPAQVFAEMKAEDTQHRS